MLRPSGEKATAAATSSQEPRTCARPAGTSHTRTILSSLPGATDLPSGEKASERRSPSGMIGITLLDGSLLVVTVAGFVIILFFGFGKHLLSHPLPFLTHAAGWDIGALTWTGFFLLYYTGKFKFTNVRAVERRRIVRPSKLDEFGGDCRKAETVRAFVSADEYRHRFRQ